MTSGTDFRTRRSKPVLVRNSSTRGNVMLRALLGFLIAPAVPALIVYVAEATRLTSSDAMKAAMAVGLFGYLSALVLGVPAFFFLRWASRTSALAYLTTGALIGLACYAVLFLPGAIQNW